MKSTRRHELEENQLALWLADKAQAVKPHLKAIGIAVLAVLIVWLGYSFFSGRSRQKLAEGWEKYVRAGDLKEYQAVADEFENSPAGLAARQQLATLQLVEGNRRLLEDRRSGMENLENAVKNFEIVIRESGEPMLKQLATFQLGRAYESMGQLENARTQYEELRKSWSDSAYAGKAKERLDDLDRVATKDFYNWFKTAQAQSLSQRLNNLKSSGLSRDEPLSPDPFPLLDPPERKEDKTPDITQPESQPKSDKAVEPKQPETKSQPTAPLNPPAGKSELPKTEPKPAGPAKDSATR